MKVVGSLRLTYDQLGADRLLLLASHRTTPFCLPARQGRQTGRSILRATKPWQSSPWRSICPLSNIRCFGNIGCFSTSFKNNQKASNLHEIYNCQFMDFECFWIAFWLLAIAHRPRNKSGDCRQFSRIYSGICLLPAMILLNKKYRFPMNFK